MITAQDGGKAVSLTYRTRLRWKGNIKTDENEERYQLDATILFIIINNYICFGYLYAHLQEYRLYTTAYGVQHCKRELCVLLFFSVGLPVANAPDVPQPCGLLYYP
jgi:hypothetical protein